MSYAPTVPGPTGRSMTPPAPVFWPAPSVPRHGGGVSAFVFGTILIYQSAIKAVPPNPEQWNPTERPVKHDDMTTSLTCLT